MSERNADRLIVAFTMVWLVCSLTLIVRAIVCGFAASPPLGAVCAGSAE